MLEDHTNDTLRNYWHDGVPAHTPTPIAPATTYNTIVVGAGLSGLAVAWGLARVGRSVLVVDAGEIGHGASSRSGGMVGPSFHKLGLTGLTSKYGKAKAGEIMRAGIDALDYCQDLFSSEDFDVDFSITGRFRGARTEADLTAMIAECERLKTSVGLEYEVVDVSDMAAHTGAGCYLGGIHYPRDGGVHPRKLTNAIAARAERAGAALMTKTEVRAIRKGLQGFEVEVPAGVLRSTEVVLCTNGYSTFGVKEMRDRVVPVDVTVGTTRDLGPERIRLMSPRLQMHGESGRVFTWSRPSPDGCRFIFGGRLSDIAAPAKVQRRQIAANVRRMYAELEAEDFEFVWNGRIAYTTDHAPHLNQVNGMWLMGGYCGSGVTRSFYFADKLVRKMTGQSGGQTPFDDLTFSKVPFRRLAPTGARYLAKYYAWRDNLSIASRKMIRNLRSKT